MIGHGAAGDDVREAFAVASRRLRRRLSFDAAGWFATDPATSLPSGVACLANLQAETCARCWELELLSEDVNSFRPLAAAAIPARSLSLASGGCPARSQRFRDVLDPSGFTDELRLVLRAEGIVWGTAMLLRGRDQPPFAEDEIELAARASQPLTDSIRADVRRPLAPAPIGRAPGFMLFAPTGELLSRDRHAVGLLEELASEPAVDAGSGVRLPIAIATTLVAARAVAERRTTGPARTRLRSRQGCLLAAHASCLADENGSISATALVIEPATSADIIAIALRAHALTSRERQIAGLILQGTTTTAMAGQLHLSIHTVRDHVKSILQKLRVSTRGELVAKLTANRPPSDTVTHRPRADHPSPTARRTTASPAVIGSAPLS